MRHHEHYLGWTIEWEAANDKQLTFWICYEDINTTANSITKKCLLMQESRNVDRGIQRSRHIIDQIIWEQKKAIHKTHADYEIYDKFPQSTDESLTLIEKGGK
ncbi:hypothetical protein [Chamaesiphon sp. VAR_48_metabat_403]|uniref:hypothetical protein n=1 Tax=Chamaesiphon sp. VAR_48_metabat_403 TaxID=2964700 RepID=UPI00286DC64C|nr:hypothetical protein [Chamaesiphon sp. VAR_48_metabat_403]